MPFSTIGNHRLAYRLQEDGPESFVFVHGLGASRNSFEQCFDMEAFKDYTLAAVDLPGCGESSAWGDFSYSMKDQADILLRWISDLALDQIILVGHSMGGVICLYLAEALGKQVRAFFNLEGNISRQDCTFSAKIASSDWTDFENRGLEEFKSAVQGLLQETQSPGLKNYYRNISRAHPRAIHLSSVSLVRESCEGNLDQRFLALPLQKWYVFGERSTSLTTKSFLDQHNIPYFVVPESGHFMMDDQPELLYRMLLDALH